MVCAMRQEQARQEQLAATLRCMGFDEDVMYFAKGSEGKTRRDTTLRGFIKLFEEQHVSVSKL